MILRITARRIPLQLRQRLSSHCVFEYHAARALIQDVIL
jgi:hypothetical protein